MAKAPGDGWELLLSGQLPKSAPDSCAPHLTPGESTSPGGWVWPLAAASPQVLVSGEHLTAEAPGNWMAPRFITPRTCFFIYMYIYLFFLFYYAGSLLLHRLSLGVASGGYSLLWCMGFSRQRLLLLQSMGARVWVSVTVAHGLSCSEAYGIFPDQGSNPSSLHWQADSHPLYHRGGLTCFLNKCLLWTSVWVKMTRGARPRAGHDDSVIVNRPGCVCLCVQQGHS